MSRSHPVKSVNPPNHHVACRLSRGGFSVHDEEVDFMNLTGIEQLVGFFTHLRTLWLLCHQHRHAGQLLEVLKLLEPPDHHGIVDIYSMPLSWSIRLMLTHHPCRPLKIKVHIRDLWNNHDSAVQQAFTTLKSILGYPIDIQPEWPLLWADLQGQFPDSATFVPTIAQIVVSWCTILENILEKEEDPSWTETLLEKVGQAEILKLTLEVMSGSLYSTRTRPKARCLTCFTGHSGRSGSFNRMERYHTLVHSAPTQGQQLRGNNVGRTVPRRPQSCLQSTCPAIAQPASSI